MPTAEVKHVIAVPRDALVLRREGTSIFRIAADNTAEQINVITGMSDGEYIEVMGSVSAGDRVVIRGAERLSSGMQVDATSSIGATAGSAATN